MSFGKLMSVAGWVLFVALTVNHAMGYGTRWEFGRYWMQRPLIGADGRYLDGGTVGPFTMWLVREDISEESLLVMLGLIGLAVAWAGYGFWKDGRQERAKRRRIQQAAVRRSIPAVRGDRRDSAGGVSDEGIRWLE